MKTAALDKVEHRVPAALAMQTFVFLIWGFWRAAGSMLIGMALYELGVFSAQRSPAFYTGLIAVGLRLGVPAVGCGVRSNFADDWGPLSQFYGSQRSYWAAYPSAWPGWLWSCWPASVNCYPGYLRDWPLWLNHFRCGSDEDDLQAAWIRTLPWLAGGMTFVI